MTDFRKPHWIIVPAAHFCGPSWVPFVAWNIGKTGNENIVRFRLFCARKVSWQLFTIVYP